MPSPNERHVLANLRLHLHLTQQAMADLVGVSVDLVKSVELLRAPLSPALAKKIAAATGVRIDWLLKNDPAVPPQSSHTVDYTIDFFRMWTARRNVPLEEDLRDYVPVALLARYVSLRGVAQAAAAKSEHDAELLLYDFEEFVSTARTKYGSLPGFDVESKSHSVTPNQIRIVKEDVRAAEAQIRKESRLFGAPENSQQPI